ncbi:hypothetical protein CBL_10605 [Carabus blaptoides fortunei]
MEELKAMMKVMMDKMEENMKEIKQEIREIKTEMDKKEEVLMAKRKDNVGIEDTGNAKGGVGLIVAPNRIKEIINEKCTNERLLKVDMKQDVNDDAQKEEKDKFFENLQK